MARFLDKVGFAPAGVLVDGVWSGTIVEHAYKGEVIEDLRSVDQAEKVNDDVRLQTRIKIVADQFALDNFSNIRYVMWRGTRWQALNVSLARPELTISLGGAYHGELPA